MITVDWDSISKSDTFKTGQIDSNSSDDDLGDAMDLVYLMLGRAISDWGEVERTLSGVFTNCFPIMHSAPAGHAFFEPRSFQTQLNMTSRAVVIACQKSLSSEEMTQRWWEIYKKVDKLSIARNKLAHGSVVCDKRLEDDYFFIRFVAFASASLYDRTAAQYLNKKDSKHWQTIPKHFTAMELHRLAADFHCASELLRNFSSDLCRVHHVDEANDDDDNANPEM